MPEEESRPEGGKIRLEGVFLFLFFKFLIFASEEGELWLLRTEMMRPNRGFILLLLNGTALLVRKLLE